MITISKTYDIKMLKKHQTPKSRSLLANYISLFSKLRNTFVLIFLSFSALCQNGSVAKVPINSFNGNPDGYVIYLPSDYDVSGQTEYPVIFWFHGLGERGWGSNDELDKIYNGQISHWLKSNDVPFIVFAPQDHSGYWDHPNLENFIIWAKANYPIDLNQIHTAGLSAGGYGLRSWLQSNTPEFRSIATMTPMSTNFTANGMNDSYRQILIDAGIWVWFHSGKNDTAPNNTQQLSDTHDFLYDADPSISRLTEYEGVGHSAWEEVYDNSGRNKLQTIGNIPGQDSPFYNWTDSDETWYEWLLSHPKKGTLPPDMTAPLAPVMSSVLALDTSSIAISWLSSSEPDLSSYNLYRGENSGFPLTGGSLVYSGSGLSYTDILLSPETNYYYVLTALDTAGNESLGSLALSAQTDAIPDMTAPLAPVMSSVTALDTSSIAISWLSSSEPDLSSYNLYRGESGGFALTGSSLVYTGSGLSYTDISLSPETRYYYVLTALDTAGNESLGSLELTAQTDALPDVTAPLAPVMSSVLALDTSSISVSWLSSSEPDLLSYNLYRGESSRFPLTGGSLVYSGSGLSYTDISLSPETRYYYVLTALDTAGNESQGSAEISVQTESLPDVTAPLAPVLSSVTALDTSSIAISWLSSTEPDLSSYNLYRGESSGFTLTAGSLVYTGSGLSYADISLSPETRYYYVLTALDTAGNESQGSEEISVQTESLPDVTAPLAPVLSSVTALDTSSISVSWLSSTEADLATYHLYRGLSSGFALTGSSLVYTGSGLSYTDISLSPETRYYYVLTALDTADNESLGSLALTAQTDALPDVTAPLAPVMSSVLALDTSSIAISWLSSTEPDLSSYNLYRGESSGFTLTGGSLVYSGSGLSYTDISLSPETRYYYVLTALDTAGNESQGSAEISVQTESLPDVTAPLAPVLSSVTALDTSSIAISWLSSTEPDLLSYNLYRGESSGFTLTGGSLVYSGSGLSYTDISLSPETRYYYVLTALDTAGNESQGSLELTAQTERFLESTTPIMDSFPQLEIFTGNVNVNFKTSEPGNVYWVLFHDSTVNLSSTEIREPKVGIQNGQKTVSSNFEFFDVTGLTKESTYVLLITLDDIEGNLSDSVYRLVFSTLPVDSSVDTSTVINLNLIDSTSSNLFGWNDINITGFSGYRSFNNLLDKDGGTTEVSFTAVNGILASSISGVANNDVGLNTGIYPDKVLQYAAYTTGGADFYFDGLDPSVGYKIEIHGGRTGSGSRRSSFTVNSETQELECINNKNQFVSFDEVFSDEDGVIGIQFKKVNSTWAYMNALVISELVEGEDTIPPLSPDNLTAFLQNDQIVIGWSDNREADFQSYNIYVTDNAEDPKITHLILNGYTKNSYTYTTPQTLNYIWVTSVDDSGNESLPVGPVLISRELVDSIPPSPPVFDELTVLSTDSIYLSWIGGGEADITRYNLYRGSSSGFSLSPTRLLTSLTSTSYTDSGLETGTGYYYVISALDTAGNESVGSSEIYGQTEFIVDSIPPSPPVFDELTVLSTDSIYLSWIGGGEADITGYNLYRGSSSGFSLSPTRLLTSLTSTSYTDSGLETGTGYYYVISALDTAGNESVGSSEIYGQTEFIVDSIPPSPSVFDELTVLSTDSIYLSWIGGGEADITGYNLYRGSSGGFSLSPTRLLTSLTSTSYTDSGLEAGTGYYYVITALDTAGNESVGSSEIYGQTEFIVDSIPPSPPVFDELTVLSIDSIYLSWIGGGESDIAGYNLYRGSSSGFSLTPSEQLTSLTSSAYTDTGLEAGRGYYYVVTALDTAGNESVGSAEIYAVTPTLPITTNLYKVNIVGDGPGLVLSDWNAVNFQSIAIPTVRSFTITNDSGSGSDLTIDVFNGVDGSSILGVTDNGIELNGGIFPDEVTRFGAYTSSKAKIVLSDLNQANYYTITMLGGRSGSGSRIANYVVQGQSQQLECINNNVNTIVFEEVSPDENNEIKIEFEKTSSWAYLNGIIINEIINSSARVSDAQMGGIFDEINPKEDINLEIYPNPTSGDLTIAVPFEIGTDIYMSMVDLTGRVVLEKHIFARTEIVKLDLFSIPNGIYTLIVRSSSSELKKLLIIEK